MKNRMQDLRDHLFVTIEHLLDPHKPMDIDRAKAVAQVAAVLVESAKAETQFISAVSDSRTRSSGTFFPQLERVS